MQKLHGKLFIISTPIGNLTDITIRAIETLKTVNIIATENIRTTKKLLNKYAINKKLITFREDNKSKQIPYILDLLIDQDIALISEAGSPTISDPGWELVENCRNKQCEIIPIPGPSAPITALMSSGISAQKYIFLGFLPEKSSHKIELLEKISKLNLPIIIFVPPHKLLKTFKILKDVFGNRTVVVAREMTKIHEEFKKAPIAELENYFSAPRGEITLIIDVVNKEQLQEEPMDTQKIKDLMKILKTHNMKIQEILPSLSKLTGIRTNNLYKIWIEI